MSPTSEALVVQSFRTTDVPAWITRCMRSVADWARASGLGYRVIGDELFDALPDRFRLRTQHLPQMMADLGRLLVARDLLAAGHPRVVWVDADVLVFAPELLIIPNDRTSYMCDELWIEPDADGGIHVEPRVNNCVCAFAAGTSLLPFYIDACQQIVDDTSGALTSIALGTQFLTALDRAVRLPRLGAIAMASPPMVQELAAGQPGPLCAALRARVRAPQAAVNLCASFRGQTIRIPGRPSWRLDDTVYQAAVDHLLARGAI